MPPDPKTDPNLSQEQREFVVDLQSSVETFKRFFTLFLHWRSNSDIWFHEVARTEQLPVMIDQMREIFRAKLEGFLQGSVPFELVPYLNAASFILPDRGDSDLKKALFYINDPADFNEDTT